MSRSPVLALILLFAACDDGDGSSQPLDAPGTADAPRIDARIVDAPMIDAPMIDAPGIDAPPGSVTLACMHACDAIGACVMDTDAGCVGECSADLADCTAQQVQDIDACTTLACGDESSSPLISCIVAIPCIDM